MKSVNRSDLTNKVAMYRLIKMHAIFLLVIFAANYSTYEKGIVKLKPVFQPIFLLTVYSVMVNG